ncbi:MAG: HDIG domain-containing protein [Desulfobacteraceae bacterium]|nr:MAG: HDIG domain-containing protein [Desulfobacteraceae bacterium]
MSPKAKQHFFRRLRLLAKAEYQIARLSRFVWAKWVQTRWVKVLTLLCASFLSALLLFPNVLDKPKIYKLGDIPRESIKASRDFWVENKGLTEKNRDKAAQDVLAVYDFDRSASYIVARVQDAFRQARDAGSHIPAGDLSVYRKEWDRIKTGFFETLEIETDEEAFTLLSAQRFPPALEKAVILLIKDVCKDGITNELPLIKKQVEHGGILLYDVYSKSEITLKDASRLHTLDEARLVIKKQKRTLKKDLPDEEMIAMAMNLAQLLVRPNLTFNPQETERKREMERAKVRPVYYQIKKGEILVRDGDPIGMEHLAKLAEENRAQNRMEIVNRVTAMTLLWGLLFGVLYMALLHATRARLRDERDLFFMVFGLLIVFILVWGYQSLAEEIVKGFSAPRPLLFALLFGMPLAAGSMLVCIFQGLGAAIIFSLAVAVFSTLIFNLGGQVEFLLYFYINSLIAAYSVRKTKTRGILIKAGLIIGCINVLMSIAIIAIYGPFSNMAILIATGLSFLGGFFAGVIATGLLPLIEMTFGFTTDIKLLELGNLDQPLLRELMVQAPGTYHHSVIVSNMVEATAEAIKANPLLAKVSAYYHDIGKIKKPLYFIENQMGGENRHERLAPSMSGLILIAHVKDGVELAKEHHLGREIADIIQQHHGTNLISFFYHKARELAETKSDRGNGLKEEDFRYPGPKPQTKEAGLVMLADMVEAAVRALPEANPARIQGLVQKIISHAFIDGQLDECELTLKDLHEIAKGFNQTLGGIFHQRIEYPAAVSKSIKKGKNGNSNQLSKEEPGNKKPANKKENGESIKRLGL